MAILHHDERNTQYDKVSLLRLTFKGLDDSELQEMADLTEIHTYPPGHVLCREGAYEDIFYIVADGKIVITKQMSEGEPERILRVGVRGDMVGEMALIQNAPRAATVRATSECTVLEMEKQDFETILSRSPRMAMDIIRITLDARPGDPRQKPAGAALGTSRRLVGRDPSRRSRPRVRVRLLALGHDDHL